MENTPHRMLQKFYSQAFMNPELLCLSCAHSAWTQGPRQCPKEIRQDCTMFVYDMINQLGGVSFQETVSINSISSPSLPA